MFIVVGTKVQYFTLYCVFVVFSIKYRN